jgi:hypothetical protein
MKEFLIAIGIIAAVVLFVPHLSLTPPHDAGPDGHVSSRSPFPCEVDHSVVCTWGQYQQIAEEDCARDRAQGGRCEIVSNGQRPRAVHIPSDGELTEMSHKFDDATRRLCDDLANAGYGCHVSHN